MLDLFAKIKMACSDKIPKGEVLAWCHPTEGHINITWQELLDFVVSNTTIIEEQPIVEKEEDDTSI